MSSTFVTVDVLVLVGILLVLPLGLGLIDAPGLGVLRRIWLPPALLAGVAMFLPRGAATSALAVPYAALTLALAGTAVARFAQRRSLAAAEIAALTALVTPQVAAVALVAERAAHPLFGFELPILALTVPHLHFAGFAAALIAGLVAREHPGRWATAAAISVPAGTLLVLVGYFVGDWAELAGAVVLTVGMWTVAALTWKDVRNAANGPAVRALLAVSALVLFATMVLAVWWSLGEATGLVHPTIGWMVATHGVLNALGFALCATLAHRLLAHRLLAHRLLAHRLLARPSTDSPSAPRPDGGQDHSQATPSSSRSSAER